MNVVKWHNRLNMEKISMEMDVMKFQWKNVCFTNTCNIYIITNNLKKYLLYNLIIYLYFSF